MKLVLNEKGKAVFRCRESTFVIILFLSLVPNVASANAGVPMIMVAMPVLGISIIPIVLIESIYLNRTLDLGFIRSLKLTTASNLFSTIVGVPCAWLVLVAVSLSTGAGTAFGIDTAFQKFISVTLQAAWLIPYESHLHWMIPAAGLVLLVPFFYVSWWAEYIVVKNRVEQHSKQKIKYTVRNANLITYTLLALWPIGFIVFDRTVGQ